VRGLPVAALEPLLQVREQRALGVPRARHDEGAERPRALDRHGLAHRRPIRRERLQREAAAEADPERRPGREGDAPSLPVGTQLDVEPAAERQAEERDPLDGVERARARRRSDLAHLDEQRLEAEEPLRLGQLGEDARERCLDLDGALEVRGRAQPVASAALR